ncbi:hypothetical protein CPB86DRAFT_808508 [Serendipita vermifera]|nr:hypothetical protein CPB86DRAFT_808508 [Serendipita vermifera]
MAYSEYSYTSSQGRPDKQLIVKCTFDRSMRRITFASAQNCSFDLLRTRVEQCFSLYASPFIVSYKDDDGEVTDINSDEDLTEAIQYFHSGDDGPISSSASAYSSRSSSSSGRKIVLRVDVHVDYDGPSLSDTASLSSLEEYKDRKANGSEFSFSLSSESGSSSLMKFKQNVAEPEEEARTTIAAQSTTDQTTPQPTLQTQSQVGSLASTNSFSLLQRSGGPTRVPSHQTLPPLSTESIIRQPPQPPPKEEIQNTTDVFERLKLAELNANTDVRTPIAPSGRSGGTAQWLREQNAQMMQSVIGVVASPSSKASSSLGHDALDSSRNHDRSSDILSSSGIGTHDDFRDIKGNEEEFEEIAGSLELELGQGERGNYYYTYTGSSQGHGGADNESSQYSHVNESSSLQRMPSTSSSNGPHYFPDSTRRPRDSMETNMATIESYGQGSDEAFLQYLPPPVTHQEPSGPNPEELTECSSCGVVLDTFRYVCSVCGPRLPRSLTSSLSSPSSSVDMDPNSKGKGKVTSPPPTQNQGQYPITNFNGPSPTARENIHGYHHSHSAQFSPPSSAHSGSEYSHHPLLPQYPHHPHHPFHQVPPGAFRPHFPQMGFAGRPSPPGSASSWQMLDRSNHSPSSSHDMHMHSRPANISLNVNFANNNTSSSLSPGFHTYPPPPQRSPIVPPRPPSHSSPNQPSHSPPHPAMQSSPRSSNPSSRRGPGSVNSEPSPTVAEGFELCMECMETMGILHARDSVDTGSPVVPTQGIGSSGSSGGSWENSPRSPGGGMFSGPAARSTTSVDSSDSASWRRGAPKRRGQLRHAFKEKFWGPNGWADVEHDDVSKCTTCGSGLTSERYKCSTCLDMVVCRGCYSQIHEIHPIHAFVILPESKPPQPMGGPSITDASGERSLHHEGLKCSHCMMEIVGARFHCAICPSVDICSNCESAGLPGNLTSPDGGHDSSHIMIKVPFPLSAAEVDVASRKALSLWTGRDAPNIQSGRGAHADGAGDSSYADTIIGRNNSSAGESSNGMQRMDHGMKCKGCSRPIIGVRYQCGGCPSPDGQGYSLCVTCEARSYELHDPMHCFFKIPRPVDRKIQEDEPLLPPLYILAAGESLEPTPLSQKLDPRAYLQTIVHRVALCDRCIQRIVGEWFHCAYCAKDLCDSCEAMDSHDPSHLFVVFKSVVDMSILKTLTDVDNPQASRPLISYPVYTRPL